MTFMEELRAGRAKPEDIDDWVDAWHLAPGFGPPLHVHLGMTEEQYHRWKVTEQLPQEAS